MAVTSPNSPLGNHADRSLCGNLGSVSRYLRALGVFLGFPKLYLYLFLNGKTGTQNEHDVNKW